MSWWLQLVLALAGWFALLGIMLVALAHIFPQGGGRGPDQGS